MITINEAINQAKPGGKGTEDLEKKKLFSVLRKGYHEKYRHMAMSFVRITVVKSGNTILSYIFLLTIGALKEYVNVVLGEKL